MPGRRKKHHTFHVNMLKKWNKPEDVLVCAAGGTLDSNDIMIWNEVSGRPVVNRCISDGQRQELEQTTLMFSAMSPALLPWWSTALRLEKSGQYGNHHIDSLMPNGAWSRMNCCHGATRYYRTVDE